MKAGFFFLQSPTIGKADSGEADGARGCVEGALVALVHELWEDADVVNMGVCDHGVINLARIEPKRQPITVAQVA
jgi:hypothetical protein